MSSRIRTGTVAVVIAALMALVALPLQAAEETPPETEVMLEAPETADIGTTITVRWTGPGALLDEIQISDPASEEDVLVSTRVVSGDYDAHTVDIVVPALPGEYVLRYFGGEDEVVLYSRPLPVELMEVLIDVPEQVEASADFAAVWTGPGAERDFIQIVDPEAEADEQVIQSLAVVNGDYDARSVTLTAPEAPGGYKLRYFNADSRVVLFERSLDVR